MVQWSRGVLACLLVATVMVSGSPVQAQPDGPFARFAGKWVGHPAMAMTIQPDGYAEVEWRVYGEWCNHGVPQPCDELNGLNGEMVFGGHAVIRFTSILGDSAIGSVRASTDPEAMNPFNIPASFTLLPNDFASLHMAHSDHRLCSWQYMMEGHQGVWDQEC